jgi:hypothetical protein
MTDEQRDDEVYEWLMKMMYLPDGEDWIMVEYESGPMPIICGERSIWRRVGPGMIVFDGIERIPGMPMYGGEPMVFRATMYVVNRRPYGEAPGQIRLCWN